jgi:hypothetical protein
VVRGTQVVAAIGLACAAAGAAPVDVLAQRCGTERWAVKTGADPGAAEVDLDQPQPSSITDLISLEPPRPIPPYRLAPVETTVFVIDARLIAYKYEGGATGDSDYHLVLADDDGKTMVGEIPSPDCVDDGSPFASLIANARAQFDGQLTATTRFQEVDLPVQVTGVGFFDFFHDQRGAAPNVIELHPILDIVFAESSGGAVTRDRDRAMRRSPR